MGRKLLGAIRIQEKQFVGRWKKKRDVWTEILGVSLREIGETRY